VYKRQLAYYAVLALPPILVILLYVASLFYSQRAATSEVSNMFTSTLGPRASQFLQTLMFSPQTHGKGPLATGIAIVALVISASGFFLELQSALNSAWGVEQRSDSGFKGIVVNRLLSFLVLAVIGMVLVGFLLATAGLAAVQKVLGDRIPGGASVWRGAEFAVSLVITTGLFALIFKLLPDVKVRWRDVWVGSAVTALLFTIGKLLLGLYFAHSTIASAYGVAGSLILLLVWIYYSAQIFLFGAEFTQVYANRFGKPLVPARHARWRIEGYSVAEDQEEADAGRRAIATRESPKAKTASSSRSQRTEKDDGSRNRPEPRRQLLNEMADHIHSWRKIYKRSH